MQNNNAEPIKPTDQWFVSQEEMNYIQSLAKELKVKQPTHRCVGMIREDCLSLKNSLVKVVFSVQGDFYITPRGFVYYCDPRNRPQFGLPVARIEGLPGQSKPFYNEWKLQIVPLHVSEGVDDSRTHTTEEAREIFLKHVAGMVDYWKTTQLSDPTKCRLEGLALSILSSIDGSNCQLPSYLLIPFITDEDIEYSKQMGNPNYPITNVPEGEMNIAGELHHDIYKYLKK